MGNLFKSIKSLLGGKNAELPDYVRAELEQVFPAVEIVSSSMRSSRRRKWRDEYNVVVNHAGVSVDIEIEVDKENANVYELEINFVKGSSNRRIDDDRPIGVEEIPATAVQQAKKYVALMADNFEPRNADVGTNAGRPAYRIRGDAGEWRVKIKIIESGEILEMQKKRRSR